MAAPQACCWAEGSSCNSISMQKVGCMWHVSLLRLGVSSFPWMQNFRLAPSCFVIFQGYSFDCTSWCAEGRRSSPLSLTHS